MSKIAIQFQEFANSPVAAQYLDEIIQLRCPDYFDEFDLDEARALKHMFSDAPVEKTVFAMMEPLHPDESINICHTYVNALACTRRAEQNRRSDLIRPNMEGIESILAGETVPQNTVEPVKKRPRP